MLTVLAHNFQEITLPLLSLSLSSFSSSSSGALRCRLPWMHHLGLRHQMPWATLLSSFSFSSPPSSVVVVPVLPGAQASSCARQLLSLIPE